MRTFLLLTLSLAACSRSEPPEPYRSYEPPPKKWKISREAVLQLREGMTVDRVTFILGVPPKSREPQVFNPEYETVTWEDEPRYVTASVHRGRVTSLTTMPHTFVD